MTLQDIDARGKLCPLPIALVAKSMRGASAGDTLTVIADDLAFPADIRAWCEQTGHELVSLDEKDDYYEARIRKLPRT